MKKIYKSYLLLSIIYLFLFSGVLSISSTSFTASLNNIIFTNNNDNLIITGTVNSTDATELTASIYSSTTIINTKTTTSTGGASNTFSLSNIINDTYTPGNYFVILTNGVDNVNMSFKVVSQKIYLNSYLIRNEGSIINVSTDTALQTGDENFLGGYFTELLNLSLSSPQTIHYGNYTINGKVYHFVLVDQNTANIFDRLYIDDDTNFDFSNDTEDGQNGPDIEYQDLKIGSKFSNTTFKYIVGFIEKDTGNKLILWIIPDGKPPYDTSDTVNLIVLTRNSTNLLPNQNVMIHVLNSTGYNITPTIIGTSNNFGWFYSTFTFANLRSGFYIISLNNSLGLDIFPVESFKIFAAITDQSNNPTNSFSPNSQVRITINSKNVTGSLNLDSMFARIYYPDGTSITKVISDFTKVSDGVYRYDASIGSLTGNYRVVVDGVYGSNAQSASTSFDVKSTNFEMMAVNMRYIEDAEGSEAMVDSFPPNSNVTIMTFLTNITAGGMSKKGPEGFTGLITPDNCNSSLIVVGIVDENGFSYLNSISYRVMNLSDALDYLGASGMEPPEQFLSQCIIVFESPSKTGTYRLEVKMRYRGEEKYSGVKFGVQRLLARGSTVDFKGDDFGFFAPNSTVRIKLKVTDMTNDQELSGSNITSGKIIEMYKVFPNFRDIIGNSTERNTLNESISNGTIVLNSPLEEGFYMAKFRFSANVDGSIETGTGDAFFMLKKYMIWANLESTGQGPSYVSEGQVVNLSVIVLDISKAQTIFGGYSQQKSCTGCGGFIINVSQIRNDQQFKEIHDYTVQTGAITNTSNPTATVSITPSDDMETGWYSVDLIVTDPSTNDTYFGWGGFEIRNFWVDMRKANYNQTGNKYSFEDSFDNGPVFPVGKSVYFVVLARDPKHPEQLLDPDSVSLASVMSGGQISESQPVPLTEGEDYLASVSEEEAEICFNEGQCESDQRYVVNLTVLSDETGDYMANVLVINGSASDVGTFWFSQSSYNIYTDYRAETWPPLFSSSENLIVNFTALDFDENPVNITNATVDKLINTKKGRPTRMTYGQNYTTTCQDNFCSINITLSSLDSSEYDLGVAVIDEDGNENMQSIFFRIQNLVVSIPYIGESWVWETDTATTEVENNIRKGEWTWCIDDREMFPNSITLCADVCQQDGCHEFNLTLENTSYSKELFGRISLVEDWAKGRFGAVTNKDDMWFYSNGTHLWTTSTLETIGENEFWINITGATPIQTNQTFSDSSGGLWRLDKIGDQTLTLAGLTTVPRTGVLINTSYSKSGIIKIGQIREEEIGAKKESGRSGIDLDDDGYTNGTVYFAITDNSIAGVYDSFFFSSDGNFTGNASPSKLNPISVNDPDRANKEFGKSLDSKKRLTLLSIDPRATGFKFYSYQIGDWNNLGDWKLDNNITIPIMVISPDGVPQKVNISITGYKDMRTSQFYPKDILQNIEITGLGEIKFNSSQLGSGGDYAIAIQGEEPVEEWKWPMVTLRTFLVDLELGEGIYIDNFRNLEINKYTEENTALTRIYSDIRNQTRPIDGVLTYANEMSFEQCTNSTPVDPNVIKFLKDDNNGPVVYFLYNISSQKLYINGTDPCYFDIQNLGQAYDVGNTFIINRNQKNYNVTILAIDNSPYNNNTWSLDLVSLVNDTSISFPQNQNVYNVISVVNATTGTILPNDQYQWNATHFTLTRNDIYSDGDYNITYQYNNNYWRADFGVSGVNSSIVLPMSDNGNPQWGIQWGYIQDVNIFGTYYDVIMANSTGVSQICILENQQECAKKTWFISRSIGNFSSSQVKGVSVGENFTTQLYLADVGPNLWNGLTIGNFSQIGQMISQLPAIGGINFADGTTSLFTVLNETALNIDLDKDNLKNHTFYMLVFDSKYDNNQNLSSMLIDDDLELYNYNTQNGTAIDLTGYEYYVGQNANWTSERWESLPGGINNGNARFGEDYPNVQDWSLQPSWQLPFFNNTHMLLKKDEWKVNKTKPVDVVLKTYEFDQTAISNANISVSKIGKASFMGFETLVKGIDYTIDETYNITDQYGYSLLKVTSISEWEDGNYQVLVNVQSPKGTEVTERWFCVGQQCGG